MMRGILPAWTEPDPDLYRRLGDLIDPGRKVLAALERIVPLSGKRIADVALAHRLPAITMYPSFPEVGGLIGYGPDLPELWRRAASFVDRILKGTPPGDLPIERPAKYHLVINLRTAKAIGLTIPPVLLLQADHVIK